MVLLCESLIGLMLSIGPLGHSMPKVVLYLGTQRNSVEKYVGLIFGFWFFAEKNKATGGMNWGAFSFTQKRGVQGPQVP